MIDYEKVIAGLECCKMPFSKCYDGGCPYFEDEGCKAKLKREAMELLKAQEPRVMTLEEVISANPGTVVWLEDDNKPDVISGLLKRLFIHTKVIDFLIVKEEVDNEVTADLEVYGKGWRCWTSRPTDEQREATPWERLN